MNLLISYLKLDLTKPNKTSIFPSPASDSRVHQSPEISQYHHILITLSRFLFLQANFFLQEFLKRLQYKVNIVPVIAKADTLTVAEV